MTVALDHEAIARLLNRKQDRIAPTAFTITSPFWMRRRGVELKLHLAEAPPEIDQILVQNIVTAQRWLVMIIDGKPLAEIAEQENTTSQRVRMATDLALLAPDVLEGSRRDHSRSVLPLTIRSNPAFQMPGPIRKMLEKL